MDTGSEETEEEDSMSIQSETSRKRKIEATAGEDAGNLTDRTDGSEKKRGRPRTTGLFVDRAKAIEEWNRQKREALDLDHERAIRDLSSG